MTGLLHYFLHAGAFLCRRCDQAGAQGMTAILRRVELCADSSTLYQSRDRVPGERGFHDNIQIAYFSPYVEAIFRHAGYRKEQIDRQVFTPDQAK